MSVTISGLLLTDFAFDMFKHVCGGITHHRMEKALDQVGRRFSEGNLPKTDQFEEALRLALGRAARCLAYRLYDPKRQPMGELLENISDWPNFYRRFMEAIQNNVMAGNPREAWLAQLIDVSKNPDNFHDFPLTVILNQPPAGPLSRPHHEAQLRRHIYHEFLSWVNRHVPDNGFKPGDFAEKVEHGWLAAEPQGPMPDFYEVFCLFFREQLNEEPAVFQAYSINVFADLQQDLEEVKQKLPNPDLFNQFELATRRLSDFQAFLLAHNQQFYLRLHEEFSQVRQSQDQVIEKLDGINSSLQDVAKASSGRHTTIKNLQSFAPGSKVGTAIAIGNVDTLNIASGN